MNLNEQVLTVNAMSPQHKRLYAQRQGVSDTTIKLLLRAEGMDLLLAAEQVETDTTVEEVPCDDGSVFSIRIVKQVGLFFPVAGYPVARHG